MDNETRILILCGLVEKLSDVVFVHDSEQMEWVHKALHEIKIGMGTLKE